MIASLSGTVLSAGQNQIVLGVGGVGYRVYTNADTALGASEGEAATLFTYLAVRENALDLYGFRDEDTIALFELLITVSGIGPKTALGVLNTATPGTIRQAVATEDAGYLSKTSGLGRKNAEKIVLELKGKLVATADDAHAGSRAGTDALEALVSLGYSAQDARDALKRVPKDVADTSERIKAALKNLQ